MPHLFPHFLTDKPEYAQSEAEWAKLWDSIPNRDENDWRAGWFKLNSANDGNPIFTAISDKNQKAIRVIQYEPTSDDIEIDCWLDTFGGSAVNPSSIRELVIACALSDESLQVAHNLIASWVVGELELENESDSNSSRLRIGSPRPRWNKTVVPFDFPASQ